MRMNAALSKMSLRRGRRTATNVSLDAALVAEAKVLGISISQAANRGLEEEVKRARSERWIEENKTAFNAYNDWMDANGLPLEKFRLF
jgi:antitoxin CcdA